MQSLVVRHGHLSLRVVRYTLCAKRTHALAPTSSSVGQLFSIFPCQGDTVVQGSFPMLYDCFLGSHGSGGILDVIVSMCVFARF